MLSINNIAVDIFVKHEL